MTDSTSNTPLKPRLSSPSELSLLVTPSIMTVSSYFNPWGCSLETVIVVAVAEHVLINLGFLFQWTFVESIFEIVKSEFTGSLDVFVELDSWIAKVSSGFLALVDSLGITTLTL